MIFIIALIVYIIVIGVIGTIITLSIIQLRTNRAPGDNHRFSTFVLSVLFIVLFLFSLITFLQVPWNDIPLLDVTDILNT